MNGLASAASLGTTKPVTNRLAWRLTLLALGIVMLAIGLNYPETIASAYGVWMNSETHKFSVLVIPMSLYIIWERRGHLHQLAPSPNLAAVLLAIPFSALWLLADVMHLALAAQLAVVST